MGEPNVEMCTVNRADWRPLARSGAFEAEVWSMLADDEMGEDQLSVLDYRGEETNCDPTKVAAALHDAAEQATAQGGGLVLDLDDCCLGDDGVAKALPGPAPIQELLLGENNVSTVGAAAVGALVAHG